MGANALGEIQAEITRRILDNGTRAELFLANRNRCSATDQRCSGVTDRWSCHEPVWHPNRDDFKPWVRAVDGGA